MEYVLIMQLSKHDTKLAQRTMNEVIESKLKIDGGFGPASQDALKIYQFQLELPVTGIIDEATWDNMSKYIAQRFITIKNLCDAARSISVSPASLLSLYEVESIGEGFLSNGKCVILFERHKFYSYVRTRLGLKQAEDWKKSYPDLCHPVWDARYYSSQNGEWERLQRAMTLDATCALLSASWGVFQVMGFNYAMMGYPDVQNMVSDFQISEQNQLAAECKLLMAQPKLMTALRSLDFENIARIYNGSAYKKNNYDSKLRAAYQQWLPIVGN